MSWAVHVSCMGTWEVNTRFHSENLREKDNLGDLGLDDEVILRSILKRQGVKAW